MTDVIVDVRAREVWDSRGLPTIEAEVVTSGGAVGRGIAPAGASTGRREAIELRDGGTRLRGLGVRKAVAQVHDVLAPVLRGMLVADQATIDAALDAADVDPQRSHVGGNTTTAVSLAVAHAAAAASDRPLWAQLGGDITHIPRPQIQIMGGGAHAANRVAVQDFMAYPLSATTIADALSDIAEVYRAVGDVMRRRGEPRGVADEGGHWPEVADTRDALQVLVDGMQLAGLRPGVDMAIALDIAATQFHADGVYRVGGIEYDTQGWIAELAALCAEFPVATIEDPAGEDDADGMALAVKSFGAVVVGDDFLVTDAARIEAAAAAGQIGAALIKVNQAGTVSRAAAAVQAARAAGAAVIVSARSGETEDMSVAHLASGWNADIVKVGSITRGERTAKWNELIRIDEACGGLPLAPVVAR
ncbi:phosphopyruvate hydratase [Microbacterium sp. H1-D42]|uniref:phosphopyruvate hydratase n=1 Tax=Microbacterium sp. H1-D42 TaxID=2925844 RepID=UPI001F52D855|nr:phosphopyruvate hydratase [Microbacterium sp. H1-D42]UNK70442.1 phosphopyruvate hydratase [Microbacterium sp. H1-D42]